MNDLVSHCLSGMGIGRRRVLRARPQGCGSASVTGSAFPARSPDVGAVESFGIGQGFLAEPPGNAQPRDLPAASRREAQTCQSCGGRVPLASLIIWSVSPSTSRVP